jgi:hypothetical protein
MSGRRTRWFTAKVEAHRVVIAVSPRLLADAVRRLLQLGGITTVEPATASRSDIAVVSPGRESEVDTQVVITLAADSSTAPPDGCALVRDLAGLRTALAGAGLPLH